MGASWECGPKKNSPTTVLDEVCMRRSASGLPVSRWCVLASPFFTGERAQGESKPGHFQNLDEGLSLTQALQRYDTAQTSLLLFSPIQCKVAYQSDLDGPAVALSSSLPIKWQTTIWSSRTIASVPEVLHAQDPSKPPDIRFFSLPCSSFDLVSVATGDCH